MSSPGYPAAAPLTADLRLSAACRYVGADAAGSGSARNTGRPAATIAQRRPTA